MKCYPRTFKLQYCIVLIATVGRSYLHTIQTSTGCPSVTPSLPLSHVTRHTFALLISLQPLPRSMPDFAHTLLACQTTTSKDPRSSRDPQVPGGPPDVKNDQMCKNDQMTTPTGLLTGNSRGPPTPGAPERMQKWWRPQWRTPCHCSAHKMP